MVKHKHKGKRYKTRKKYKKNVRQKGATNINLILQKFNIGDTVHIAVDPSFHKGMPFRRFHGKTGRVTAKQGDCYLVVIKDQRAEKEVLAHPAHLKPTGESK